MAPKSLPRWVMPLGWMPLNARGLAGKVEGLADVAAGSVVMLPSLADGRVLTTPKGRAARGRPRSAEAAHQRCRLVLGLQVLVRRVRVPDDATADAEAEFVSICPGGADDDAQVHLREIVAEPPQRAGVGTARSRLQVTDQVHGRDLGAAGHGAAGERGLEGVPERGGRGGGGLGGGGGWWGGECGGVWGVRAGAPLVGGYDVHDPRVALQVREGGHAHRWHVAYAGEVVAEQVHDHGQLTAVLGAGKELRGCFGVAGGVRIARGSALDRPSCDDAVADAQERLGAGADYGEVGVDDDGGGRRSEEHTSELQSR